MKTIEVPTLSQSNDIHDEYRSNSNSTEQDDVRLHPGTGMSNGWCGRASAAMIYNYLTRVDAYIRGATEEEAASLFIKNNRDTKSGEYLDLIYPEGEVAAPDNGFGYALSDPLERAVSGWERKYLFPRSDREERNTELNSLTLSESAITEKLSPIVDSLRRNTPVLAYTGISKSKLYPRHIIVVCGYEMRADGLWLKFADPSTMREIGSNEKGELLDPNDEGVLKVEQEGLWSTDDSDGEGSLYWLKASRLFEEQQNSEPPRIDTDGDGTDDESKLDFVKDRIAALQSKESLTVSERNDLAQYEQEERRLEKLTSDLWLDHSSRGGLAVWIHPSHVTPPSPYASGNVIAHVPVDLGDETQAERLFLKTY